MKAVTDTCGGVSLWMALNVKRIRNSLQTFAGSQCRMLKFYVTRELEK